MQLYNKVDFKQNIDKDTEYVWAKFQGRVSKESICEKEDLQSRVVYRCETSR